MIKQCVWKSDEDKVSETCCQNLVSLLIEAERQRWVAEAGAVRAVENSRTQEGSPTERSVRDEISAREASDPGWILLGHGNLIKTIHSYFQNLEPHRYCLSLTNQSRKRDRADGKIRVLHTSQDGTPLNSDVSQSSVTAGEQSRALSLSGELSEKDPEFELYEKAVLCARFPVLGIPPSPSPYSPVSSPASSPTPGLAMRRAFSFGDTSSSVVDGANAMDQPRYRGTACVTPDNTGPIDSDTLWELVREAFHLSKRRHLYYRNLIIERKRPKDPARVLVEELLSQLSVLESNHHPFYRVQSFMDKNAYSEWLLLEKERILVFIKSFWRSPMPPFPALPLRNTEKHTEYRQLMIRLIRYESKQTSAHTHYGDVTPTGPLSAVSCRLLKEFGRRYGVGQLYRRIVYLRYLADHFENEVWYIKHVTTLLESTMELSARNQEILVKQQFLMFLEAITLLLKHAKYSLTRIKRLFPANAPQGGLRSLLVMLEVVLEAMSTLSVSFSPHLTTLVEAHDFLNAVEDEPIQVLLARFIESEIAIRYESCKVICMDELNAHSIKTTASPQLLNLLIINVRDEVKNYKDFFQQDFAKYFDIVNVAAVKYYHLLMEDVDEVCSNPSEEVQDDEVDLQSLSLAFRLSVLDQDWAKYISVSMQTWRLPCQGLAHKWLDAIGYHMQHMVTMVMARDPWTTLPIDNCSIRGQPAGTSCLPNRRTRLNESTGRQSLTQSENSAFSSVRSLSDPPVKIPEKHRVVPEVCRVTKSKSSEELDSKVRAPLVAKLSSSYPERRAVFQCDDSSTDDEELKQNFTVAADVHRFSERKKPKHQKRRKYKQNTDTDDLEKTSKESENGYVEEKDQVESSSISESAEPAKPVGKSVRQVYEPVKQEEEPVHLGKVLKDDYDGKRTPYQNDTDTETDDERKKSESDEDSICSSDSFHFIADQRARERQTQEGASTSRKGHKKLVWPPVKTAHVRLIDENNRQEDGESADNTERDHSCDKCPIRTADISVAEIEEVVTGTERGKQKYSLGKEQSQIGLEDPGVSSAGIFSPDKYTVPSGVIKTSQQILRVAQPGSKSASLSGATDYNSCASSPGSFWSRSEYISCSSTETIHSSIAGDSDVRTKSVGSDNSEVQWAFAHESGPHGNMQAFSASPSVSASLAEGESLQRVLPISGSLVDLICSINRLVAFTCHLCKVLCSDEKPQCSDTGYVTCANEVDGAKVEQSNRVKRELCTKLVQVVYKFIQQYGDNLLGLDACGLSDELLQVTMDEPLLAHYKVMEEAGHIVGCRYQSSVTHRCNTVGPSGRHIPSCEALSKAMGSPGSCEPTTSAMAVRITNGIVLSRVLPWLHEHIVSSVQNPNLLVSSYQGGGGVKSETYCQYGPCPDGSSAATSKDTTRRNLDRSGEFGSEETVRECGEHLTRVRKAQLLLLAYRMNVFVRQVIRTLLELELPSFAISKRLRPATEFLEKKLKIFDQILYPDCFNDLISIVWLYLIQDFIEECRKLRDMNSRAYDQSKLLLQAIAHMMEFFYGSGEGLQYAILLSTSEPLLKILGLYSNRTDRLINMYRWLGRQVIVQEHENVANDFISASSMSSASGPSSAHAPSDSLIQSMRKELHATRKCFSGSDLVAWVISYVEEKGYDSLGVCIGSTDMETGLEIGQYLLDKKLLVCIALPPTFDDCSSISASSSSADPEEELDEDEEEEEEEGQGESSGPTGRGSVLVEGEEQRGISVNDIAVAKRRFNGATVSNPASAAASTTPSCTSPHSEDEKSQHDVARDFLDSMDKILFRSISIAEHSVFYNNSTAMYSFVREEDTNGSENLKFKLGFTDRLNARETLLEIICVLYTRKDVDSEAKLFLRKIHPQTLVTEALGKEPSSSCFTL